MLLVIALQPLTSQAAAPEPADPASVCTPQQLQGFKWAHAEVAQHRRFKLPTVTYPFGTKLERFGFTLRLRVDPTGHVLCHAVDGVANEAEWLNAQRRALIAGLRVWTYSPFVVGTPPAPVLISEQIAEEEAPGHSVPFPSAPLEKTAISLARGTCLGSCPAYQVTLFGNGSVVYQGDLHVDVLGEHHYSVEPAQVAQLIASGKSKNLWSLRHEYARHSRDSASYILTIKVGDQTLRIVDDAGPAAGMPAVVTAFEDEVDAAAQSAAWVHLGRAAVAYLKDEDFPFKSADGGQLLLRATANPYTTDDRALLELIKLNAPWDLPARLEGALQPRPILVSALVNQRELLVDALLAKGALRTNGAIDPKKLDAAFQAAVQGGLFSLVKKIWEAGGELRPPLITRLDSPTAATTKPRPVTDLLVQSAAARELQRPWTGVGITVWLTQQAPDEDTALELLHGAVDLRTTKEPLLELRAWAVTRHWDDVVSYLDTKP